jgi:hypothetical protein
MIFKKTLNVILLIFFFKVAVFAQNEVTITQKPKINLSGFLDAYYVYDFNQPTTIKRQSFLFNHNRHNQPNLNLGIIKLNLDHQKYRANLALHAGTYSKDNYASEPGILKNIFEANVGFSLNKEHNLWLDAGIFASHIGFESAISSDNWTMTRSILAENSPYFLSGAKLTYNPNEKWKIGLLILNGWQRIQPLKGNSLPSFGTQMCYTPTNNISLNWNTFIGTDDPDLDRRMRYFNNFYGQFKLTEKFGLIAGFDIGAQQTSKKNTTYNFWLSPVLIGQYVIDEQWKTALRAEYYQDKNGVIISTPTLNGFRTSGLSLNLDYSPLSSLLFRIEGRWLNGDHHFLDAQSSTSNNNLMVGPSVAYKF